jgi:uncharacterized protein (TIGR02246 family)
MGTGRTFGHEHKIAPIGLEFAWWEATSTKPAKTSRAECKSSSQKWDNDWHAKGARTFPYLQLCISKVRLVSRRALGLYSADPLPQKEPTVTPNEQAVADVLAAYNVALNSSDTNQVMPLYADDGVFMAPYSTSAVGRAAVRNAYDAVFKAIKLTVKFDVAEIVEVSPDWVFARTNSAGKTLNHATGKTSAEGNQELFLFRKDKDGKFKIARYSFSPTNPPGK